MNLSRRSVLTAVLVWGAVAVTLSVTAQERREVSAADAGFIVEAAALGMAEVRLSEVAMQQAEDVEVQQFASRMLDDHTRMNNQLLQLAGIKDIEVPAELTDEDQERIDRLTRLSGADFDRAYMEEMVQDHEEAVKRFEQQVQHGQDQDVRNLAADSLPQLREHRQEAQQVLQGLQGG
jgi:putative membrane protein